MVRRSLLLVAAPLMALVWMQALVVQSTEAQAGAPYCQPGQVPTFVHGVAELQSRLGSTMGAPTECEHVDPTSGDTLQRTTTGLAYFRPSIATTMFTDGATHWALADGTVVLWRNESVTPPQPTDAEVAYLQRTTVLKSRAATLQRRLAGVRQQAERGQLDSIDPASLRSLVEELQATRDGFAVVKPPARLGRFHGMMVTSLNTAMGAAEMLAQARQIESPELRAAFLSSATKHRQESERLQLAATDAYSRALPVVVD
jgi:hypothetical protein